jgi:hypothetical protein
MTNPTTPTRAESIVETAARIKALAEDESSGRFSSVVYENGRYTPVGIFDYEVIALCDAVLAAGTDAAKPAGAGGADWKFRATTLAECLRYALDVGYDDEALDEFVNKNVNDCRDYLASFDRALAASSDTPAQGMEP